MADALPNGELLVSLAAFLDTLAGDAVALASRDADSIAAHVPTPWLDAGLNHLLKIAEHGAEGIAGAVYLEAAFVLRVAAALTVEADSNGPLRPEVSRLAQEAHEVHTFLSRDAVKFVASVRLLAELPLRFAPAEIEPRVRAWSQGYEPPAFLDEVRAIDKLRAFFASRMSAGGAMV